MINKILSTLFIIFLSVQSYAADQDPNLQQQPDGAQPPCLECSSTDNKQTQQFAQEFLNRINQPFNCDKVDDKACILINWLKWKHQDYSENCRVFL